MPRRLAGLAIAVIFGFAIHAPAKAEPPTALDRICDLIGGQADSHGLPPDYFARLIWKESRFVSSAVSPAGAQGIAQFMPATARMRGLVDPFDPEQAIPASARFLAELRDAYGNLGLAAAAYNAGETRLSRWLSSGGFLPLETEDYVLDILGEPADSFAERSHQAADRPIAPGKPFDVACRELPRRYASTVAMAQIVVRPWGVQVAGNFRRAAAVGQWARLRGRFQSVLAGHEPVVSRIRSPIGRRGIYAVRIGAASRGEADRICSALRGAGGACIVMRNR